MRRDAKRLRETLIEATDATPEDAALFFSGGIDSSCVLAASLAIGRRPFLIGFRLGNRDSTDARSGRYVAKTLGLDIEIVEVPRDIETLKRDVREVINIIGQSLKAHVQVCHPFLYMCEYLREVGYEHASMGMAAVWGLSRHGQMELHKHGEAAFNEYRKKDVYNPNVSDVSVVKLAEHLGVTVHDPWRAEPVIQAMLSFHSSSMHGWCEKGLALEAFPEYFSRGNFYRKASSLQVEAGLREYHDVLLQTELNVHGHKRIVGVYNAIAKEGV